MRSGHSLSPFFFKIVFKAPLEQLRQERGFKGIKQEKKKSKDPYLHVIMQAAKEEKQSKVLCSCDAYEA